MTKRKPTKRPAPTSPRARKQKPGKPTTKRAKKPQPVVTKPKRRPIKVKKATTKAQPPTTGAEEQSERGLTQARLNAILRVAKDAPFVRVAAEAAGIGERMFRHYLARGREDQAQGLDTLYSQLVQGWTETRGQWAHSHLTKLNSAAATDPGVAKWLLSKYHPEQFGNRVQLEGGASPIRVDIQQAKEAEAISNVLCELGVDLAEVERRLSKEASKEGPVEGEPVDDVD